MEYGKPANRQAGVKMSQFENGGSGPHGVWEFAGWQLKGEKAS